jgi:hypothetical protein
MRNPVTDGCRIKPFLTGRLFNIRSIIVKASAASRQAMTACKSARGFRHRWA